MNTLVENIFNDETAEYVNLQSATPSIDLTDWECAGTPSSGTCGALTSSANFLVTSPLASVGYFELELMLANNFWGCNFSFGNSACGVQIRQGVAHMFDKNQFCTFSVVAGTCTPIDNPLPTTSGGGLPSPNPCGYDTAFPQSGSNCIVGSPGGTAYHLGTSAGANGSPWLYAPGSTDLNAAAQHLVNGGVASGFNSGTSILTGISGSAATNKPTFFIRNDNTPRRQLGESLASQMCYIFTGAYTTPCTYLNTVEGPITAFPGFTTSPTSVNLSWWIYTAAFSGPTFFDGSLYFGYNSRFISASCATPGTASCSTQKIGGGQCDNSSVQTAAANNYEYICVSNYDTMSTRMETASCLSAPGDPAIGATSNLPTSPGNGLCSDGSLSAISAGIQSEALFGGNVLTIPNFQTTIQYGYLNNGWNTGVINGAVSGLPNFFTWLNAWNAAPSQAGTVRQGFKETTRSVSPYIASTVWDTYVEGLVYDTLFASNPLSPSQLFNWMTYSYLEENNATVISQGGYTPPPHTLTTYHFTLRNDVYFQDGRPVTAYDVAFSYLSMVGSGAFLGSGAATMTGITVLGPRAFDIAVSAKGPFEVPNITAIPIVSGRYWTNAGTSSWDTAIATCTGTTPCPKAQYALNVASVICPSAIGQPGCGSPSPSAATMTMDPTKTTATYDPIAGHTLVGSGPFTCGTVTSSGSGNCSSSGTQNPPIGGSYFLTRFGNGLPPASSTSGIYFRSSGDLALYIWSQQNDANPIQPVSAVSICFGLPVPTGSCTHWQHGIGASGSGVVGINQVSAVELRYNLNWIGPFEWASSPPLGIAALPPVLYEGSVTLNPCTIQPTTGYDC